MPTTGGSAVWIPIVGVILILGFAVWEIRKSLAR
jgi:LPXTG-motif cell wall-anchored protein